MTNRHRIHRKLVTALSIGTVLLAAPAYARESGNVFRIGVLLPAITSVEEGLRQGLGRLGYVEGQQIVIEWRRSDGSYEELRTLAAEVVRSRPDVIVAVGTSSAQAASAATSTIPIVFMSGDPVGRGLVKSLAQPGGNSTGLSVTSPDLTAKRLEFLRQVVPRFRHIVYVGNSASPAVGPQLQQAAEAAAASVGVQLVTLNASDAAELKKALGAIRLSRADGVLISSDLLFAVYQAQIAQAIREAKLPAIFPYQESHEDGALMSFGVSLRETMRRAAAYVDKILRGAKPAELPVEEISTYKLIIDLRVAHQLGIEFPPALLLRADEVIR